MHGYFVGIESTDSNTSSSFVAFMNLAGFAVAQIVGEKAAFCFHDKVETLGAIFFYENSPIGIIGAERRGNFEPAGEFSVNFDSFIFFEVLRETTFNLR
jgi:hypothetical protein